MNRWDEDVVGTRDIMNFAYMILDSATSTPRSKDQPYPLDAQSVESKVMTTNTHAQQHCTLKGWVNLFLRTPISRCSVQNGIVEE